VGDLQKCWAAYNRMLGFNGISNRFGGIGKGLRMAFTP
jgi:hypothetical protein